MPSRVTRRGRRRHACRRHRRGVRDRRTSGSGHNRELIPAGRDSRVQLKRNSAVGSLRQTADRLGRSLPNGDVCATGGYDAMITCWQVPGAANFQPVLTATPVSGTAPLTVNFTRSVTSDPNGPIVSYVTLDYGDSLSPGISGLVDFGDGTQTFTLDKTSKAHLHHSRDVHRHVDGVLRQWRQLQCQRHGHNHCRSQRDPGAAAAGNRVTSERHGTSGRHVDQLRHDESERAAHQLLPTWTTGTAAPSTSLF